MNGGEVLWLAYGRTGEAGSVRHAASSDEVEAVLEWLGLERFVREKLSRGLRNFLAVEQKRNPFERRTVPVRGANGLYRLVSWRLAQWLMNALLVEGSVREEMLGRMKGWLGERVEGTVLQGCDP